MECFWNDGGKTQYYIVILDQLQDHSRGLVQAPESRVKSLLTLARNISIDNNKYILRTIT